jgi:hypothetical protein
MFEQRFKIIFQHINIFCTFQARFPLKLLSNLPVVIRCTELRYKNNWNIYAVQKDTQSQK